MNLVMPRNLLATIAIFAVTGCESDDQAEQTDTAKQTVQAEQVVQFPAVPTLTQGGILRDLISPGRISTSWTWTGSLRILTL